MPSGRSARSTAWTFDAGPLVLVLVLLCLAAATPTPAGAQEVNARLDSLRSEMSRLRGVLPDIPYLTSPSPSPDEIETLAKTSPTQAAALLAKATAELTKQAETALKKRLVETGREVSSDPTTTDTYAVRRSLLLETAEQYRRRGVPLRGIFPKGLPSRFLPESNAAEKNFRYCDASLEYLAGLFRREIEALGTAGGASMGDGGTTTSVVAAPAFVPSGPDETGARPSVAREVPLDPGDGARRSSWGLFSHYATYTVYILGVLALLGIGYHLTRGARDMARLGAGTDGGKSVTDHDELFKESLGCFQRQKYQKALAGFETVAAADHVESQRARYYAVLTHLRLDDSQSARADLVVLPLDGLSTDELYRLGAGFEEAGDPERAAELYVMVRSRDETFRDVLHRIAVLEKKAAPGDGA